MGVTEAVNIDEVADVPAWFLEQNEGEPLDIVFEMSGSPEAIGMRSGSSGTAATSSSSGSLPIRSSSTSRSRSSSRT